MWWQKENSLTITILSQWEQVSHEKNPATRKKGRTPNSIQLSYDICWICDALGFHSRVLLFSWWSSSCSFWWWIALKCFVQTITFETFKKFYLGFINIIADLSFVLLAEKLLKSLCRRLSFDSFHVWPRM